MAAAQTAASSATGTSFSNWCISTSHDLALLARARADGSHSVRRGHVVPVPRHAPVESGGAARKTNRGPAAPSGDQPARHSLPGAVGGPFQPVGGGLPSAYPRGGVGPNLSLSPPPRPPR